MISAGEASGRQHWPTTHRHATAAAAAPSHGRFASATAVPIATQITVRALLRCKRTSRGASALCCK